MSQVMEVEKRELVGKLNNRRLRASGRIPAVLYGHGKESISLSVSAEALNAAIRHGEHVVELAGAIKENALIRDLQWNTFSTGILHVDFTRISDDDVLDLHVSVGIRGVAPGTKAGGVVNHLLHELAIQCSPLNIPEKIEININSLELDQSITAGEVELPAGVKLNQDPTKVVVNCVEPAEELETEEGVDASAEPEVIGR